MIVGNRYIGDLLVLRRYIGNTLVWEHEPEPPAGRTITASINTGGDTTIDGSNLTYEGNPTSVQNGDVVVITGANAGGNVTFTNFNLASGQAIVKNNGLITTPGNATVAIVGQTRNTWFNFYNQDGVNEYGVSISSSHWQSGCRLHLDPNQVGGWENVRISGIHLPMGDFHNERAIKYGSGNDATLVWNNGSGTMSTKGLVIERIKFDITVDLHKMVEILGRVTSSEDRGYHEDLVLRNWVVNGNNCSVDRVLDFENVQGYDVHHINLFDVNTTQTSGHYRLFYMGGVGDLHHIYANNYYGNIAQFQRYRRVGSSRICRGWNVLGYNGRMYSLLEIQAFATNIVGGITEPAICEIDFLTAYQIGTLANLASTCVDRFDDFGMDDEVRNCVLVQGYNSASVAAPSGIAISNNQVHSNNSTALIDNTTTFQPSSSSPLKNAGLQRSHITDDIWGTPRAVTPTIGAVEAI